MPTRRELFTAAAGVAAAASIPLTGTAAAAGGRGIPRTLARRGRPVVGGLRVHRAPFTLSHLVVSWRGDGRPGIRTRTASGWGRWRPVHAWRDGKDGARDGRSSALVTVPRSLGYEVDGGGRGTEVTVTELNTVSGAVVRRGGAILEGVSIDGERASVRYLPRAAWGADETLRFRNGEEHWPPEYSPVQTLTVHHTAGDNNDPNPAATVRAIYYYDAVTLDWGDIGYHFLIDEAGTVYEGRWSGSDTSPAFGPAGPDGRPQLVTAAHAAGFNTGNVGVALLGDFTTPTPTDAARTALVRLLELLARVGRLDPTGTVAYHNPVNGNNRTVRTISGHRDWDATLCPGDAFYPQLPALRGEVDALLRSAARRGGTSPGQRPGAWPAG